MAAPPAPRLRWDLLIGGILGVLIVFASYIAVPSDADPMADCERWVDLEVSSSTEKPELLADLAARYGRAHRVLDGRCARVSVHGLSSGKAKIALAAGWQAPNEQLPPRPQVWLPTSTMWSRLLEHEGKGELIADERGSITASTLAIAMPKPVADALSKSGAPLRTWKDVLELARSRSGWADYGQPAWGRFLLGRDNPEASTSGLAATVATYHAAPGEISVDDPETVEFVHGIESSVARYGDEAVQFMQEIYDAEQDRGDEPYRPYVDALVVQEQLAYAYNCGAPDGDPDRMNCANKPDSPLVVVHPEDGTLEMDHPYVMLSGMSADQRAVAEDFYAFLTEDEQQRAFHEAGFRDRDRAETPTGELVDSLGLPANQRLRFVQPPGGDLLATMLDSWKNVKKRARVLLVLDVSGSMNDLVDDPARSNDPTKLALVKPAAKQALDLLDDGDEVGLWTFSDRHTEVLPISPVGTVREQLGHKIDALSATGNTALFGTTEQAHEAMVAKLDPTRINAVVLLSDGKNTVPYAGGVDALLAKLNPNGRDSAVRIFTIPYGKDSVDLTTLADVASSTRAAKYDATDPLDIGQAFVSVFQNLGVRRGR